MSFSGSKLPYADINVIISTIFKDIPDDMKFFWHDTMQIAKQIACLVVTTANKLNRTDHDVINIIICSIIAPVDNIDFCASINSEHLDIRQSRINALRDKLQSTLNILTHPATATVLDNFFVESKPALLPEMGAFLRNITRENFNQVYINDWMVIYRFLLDPEKVRPYLQKLEDELQRYAATFADENKLPTRAEDGKHILPESSIHPYQRRKVLSGYLYSWAKQNGFERIAKIVSLLSNSTFLSLLASKSIFKDNATLAGDRHGTWPHALQWYCIIEREKESPFLRHSPIEIYQQLGDDSQANAIYAPTWSYMFEQYGVNNFTSPEFITATLFNDENARKWPLLSESVKRIENKMNRQFGNRYGYDHYLLAKHAHEAINGIVVRQPKR